MTFYFDHSVGKLTGWVDEGLVRLNTRSVECMKDAKCYGYLSGIFFNLSSLHLTFLLRPNRFIKISLSLPLKTKNALNGIQKHTGNLINECKDFCNNTNRLMTGQEMSLSRQYVIENGIDLSEGSGERIYWEPSGIELITTSGRKTFSSKNIGLEPFHALNENSGILDSREYNRLPRNEWSTT